MKAGFIIISQFADYKPKKGLTVSNIIDRVTAASLPACATKLFVTFSLIAEANEKGKTGSVRFQIVDPDGTVIMAPPADPYKFPRDFPGESYTLVKVFVEGDIEFKQFGRYSFEIRNDGEFLAAAQFEILQKS